MAGFTLKEIISNTSSDRCTAAAAGLKRQFAASFGELLRAKLEQSGQHQYPQGNLDDGRRSDLDDKTFNTVRTLFSNAATALGLELKQRDVALPEKDRTLSSHWVPGRIEVMGKHTDYAGGNSLLCATAGRGMAMVSAFIKNDERNKCGMKVTIVSVLPLGMEHHATTTAALYKVEGRPVVYHTIHVKDGKNGKDKNDPKDTSEGNNTVDWTIYPTAVIHRLHQNFGLFPHSDGVNISSNGSSDGDGGHIFIALSSNLPPASGLSTSSAFVTGLFLVLDSHLCLKKSNPYRSAIGEVGDDDTIYNLSTYLGNVENGRDYINGSAILKGTVQGGVGTFGGSEDHAAILMGRKHEMRLLSFCPTRPACFDMDSIINEAMLSDIIDDEDNLKQLAPSTQESYVRLSPDLTFVIAYSGAKAEKAGGADGATEASIGYNSASELARKAFDAYYSMGGDNEGVSATQTLADAIRWERNASNSNNGHPIKERISNRIKSGVSVMKEVAPSDREEYSTALVQRFRQFYDETEYLVPLAAHAISSQRYDWIGPVVDASHRGAVNALKNQIGETAWLPLWARGKEECFSATPLSVVRQKGVETMSPPKPLNATNQPSRIKALAASAFGAGFGGSCWALVYRHQAQEFAEQWQNAYEAKFLAKKNSNSAQFFITDPGPGAFCV